MSFSSLSNYDGACLLLLTFCAVVPHEMALALDWCLVLCAEWWCKLKKKNNWSWERVVVYFEVWILKEGWFLFGSMVMGRRTLLLLVLCLCLWIPFEVVGRKEPFFSPTSVNSTVSSRPKVVKFGALFTMGSVIGRLALPAIMAAVKDVNSSTSSLLGIDLQVILHDTNCSAFLGTMVFAKT